jgi:pimeloyl-ACP methyl ester carboxylesterase
MTKPRDGTTGLVFLHGAGLGAWIWRDVLPLIAQPSLALDYPERDKTAVSRTVALEDYCRNLLEKIQAWEAERIFLVAHSIGGVVALKLASLLGTGEEAKVCGLVGISAAFPADGGSFLSGLPLPGRLVMGAMVRVVGTKPPTSMIKQGLCSDLDLDLANEVDRRYVAESPRLYTDRCEAPIPETDILYILTTEDRGFPLKVQETMAKNIGARHTVGLPTGHLPMLAKPKELADVLNRFTTGVRPDPLEIARK